MVKIGRIDMKIETHFIRECTLEKFADEYELVMEVHERRPESQYARYYAYFTNASVAADGGLTGTIGNGITPEEAIEDYGQKISLKTIVIVGSDGKERRIGVPRIVG